MNEITSQPHHVFRPDELPSKDRGGGVRTIPLVTAARGATSYLNGITVVDAGAQITQHSHNVAESVMVIAGTAVVDIDGERTTMRTFDTTFVPANMPHHFENASREEEMRIFWTYGALDATRTLVGAGSAGRVDAESAEAAGEAMRPVREVATIQVLPGHEAAFEDAVARAVPLFQRAHGARTFAIDVSEEHPQRYQLTVTWESLHDHIVGFRESPAFADWRALIGPHIDGPPQAEHFHNVVTGF